MCPWYGLGKRRANAVMIRGVHECQMVKHLLLCCWLLTSRQEALCQRLWVKRTSSWLRSRGQAVNNFSLARVSWRRWVGQAVFSSWSHIASALWFSLEGLVYNQNFHFSSGSFSQGFRTGGAGFLAHFPRFEISLHCHTHRKVIKSSLLWLAIRNTGCA